MLPEAFAGQLSQDDAVSSISEMVLEYPYQFLTLLRTSEMFVKHIDYLLRVCEILRHCEDNAYISYSTSGYLIWESIL